jgi:hypothetical protein
MRYLRTFVAVVVVIFLTTYAVPFGNSAIAPIGILILAEHAHLDDADATAGLSVFEGESLSTEEGGHLGVRVGHSTLALAGKTDVTLHPSSGGVHVDLGAGSMYFSAAENEMVEVHAEEALLRPDSSSPTQAQVSILSPRVLQITTRHGGLDFSYRNEFRNLPEGQTYRLYLDAPAEPDSGVGAGAQKAGNPQKVTYYIMGAGAAGVAVWGVHESVKSGNNPISAAKP